MQNNGISINTLESVPIRVKVMMEEVFKPAVVPLHYDSKLETGMVGLENLGATCYLNALLQVSSSHVFYPIIYILLIVIYKINTINEFYILLVC